MNAVDDAGFEVDQDGSGDVSRVVALVIEDVFAVTAFGRKVLEVPVLVDAVLLAQLLPELATDCALVNMQRNRPDQHSRLATLAGPARSGGGVY